MKALAVAFAFLTGLCAGFTHVLAQSIYQEPRYLARPDDLTNDAPPPSPDVAAEERRRQLQLQQQQELSTQDPVTTGSPGLEQQRRQRQNTASPQQTAPGDYRRDPDSGQQGDYRRNPNAARRNAEGEYRRNPPQSENRRGAYQQDIQGEYRRNQPSYRQDRQSDQPQRTRTMQRPSTQETTYRDSEPDWVPPIPPRRPAIADVTVATTDPAAAPGDPAASPEPADTQGPSADIAAKPEPSAAGAQAEDNAAPGQDRAPAVSSEAMSQSADVPATLAPAPPAQPGAPIAEPQPADSGNAGMAQPAPEPANVPAPETSAVSAALAAIATTPESRAPFRSAAAVATAPAAPETAAPTPPEPKAAEAVSSPKQTTAAPAQQETASPANPGAPPPTQSADIPPAPARSEPMPADAKTADAANPEKTEAPAQNVTVTAQLAPARAAPPAATQPITPPPSPPPSNASLERMIGQMLVVGFRGLSPDESWPQKLAAQIKAGQVGGVLFMSHNIQSPPQVKGLTGLFHRIKSDIPPLLAIDQEGGIVQRLSPEKGFQEYPTATKIGRSNDPLAAYTAYRRMAAELTQHGFNLNFGPVVDLHRNDVSPIIAGKERSFGRPPKHVAAFARAFILAHQDEGVLTVLKHFPGHGSTPLDTHVQPVDVSASWSKSELDPYRDLIASRSAQAVMVGHIAHPALAEEPGLPASLSRKAIKDILRGELAFNGVVISDDLEMGALRSRYSLEESAVKAIKAGNDIILLSNQNAPDPDLPEKIIAAVKKAVTNGTVSREELQASYDRILGFKQRMQQMSTAKAGVASKRTSPERAASATNASSEREKAATPAPR